MTTDEPARVALADAFDKAAEALATLAIEIRGEHAYGRFGIPHDHGPISPQDAPGALLEPMSNEDWAAVEALEEDALLERPKPAGSAAVCPAHGIEYRAGRYGSYCPSTSEDPEWSNDKGYCTINPKNVAIYLRKAAAAGKR